eukprot:4646151-Amphidinium_carterae.1
MDFNFSTPTGCVGLQVLFRCAPNLWVEGPRPYGEKKTPGKGAQEVEPRAASRSYCEAPP